MVLKHSFHLTKDSLGLGFLRGNIGEDLKPRPNSNNVIIAKYEYDKRGNATKISFYEADGKKLRLSDEGTAGWNDIYDDNGNQLERNFFGVNGEPIVPSGIHYAKHCYTYDEHGNIKTERYYNLQGALVLVGDVAGADYVCDRRGNVLEKTSIGTDGRLARGKLKMVCKYDEFDNRIEESMFNSTGPATNYQGVHKFVYKYDSNNQITENRYYDTSGSLVINTETKCAILQYVYDHKGYLVKAKYLGTDQKPCKNYQGWSSATYERDQFGNIVKQCFFDVNGKPTDPKDMVPVGLAKYDKWGHMVYIAAQDGHGNFIIKQDEGWAISRLEYDNKDNLLSQSYYDTKDKPMCSKYGYHKAVSTYDKQGRKLETYYYGTDNKPMLVEGYHKITFKYAEMSDKLIEQALFDKNGKKVNCTEGWHKLVVTYNEDFTVATFKKFYVANGTLFATLKWNGDDWVLVQKEYDWQKDARELAAQLPIDFGAQAFGLTIQTLSITGEISCELHLTFPSVASEMSSSDLKGLKDAVNGIIEMVEEGLRHKPYVTGNLYDKNGTRVYSYRK